MTKQLIASTLKDYFNDEQLKVSYQLVEKIADETPRQKQIKHRQAMLVQAQNKLLSDTQVNQLIQGVGASLVTDSIKVDGESY
jgi:hypothetical protein